MASIKVHSIKELLERSNALLEEAAARRRAVFLVVRDHRWAEARKLQLQTIAPLGIQVLTFSQLVEQLWDLFGDGRGLVQVLERKVLLRPLVTQVGILESSPSANFVSQLSAFVQEAIYSGLEPSSPLSVSDSKLMKLVELYDRRLRSEGLIEPVQAEAELLSMGACAGMSFVFEAPDLHVPHVQRFVANLEPDADVSVLEQELQIDPGIPLSSIELEDVRHRLFTGFGDVEAQGHVRVGLAQGAHVESDVIAQLVSDVHRQNGIAYGDIAVCLASPSESYPWLTHALAAAQVPFLVRFSLPLFRTGLGAAFVALESIAHADSDDASFDAAVDLLLSPYSGVPGKDARALQMRWREQAHSSQARRLLDIRGGFEQGNVQAKETKQRLTPLAQLLDAALAQRVELLFEHAKQGGVSADALIDDVQAADALLSYLETCERFSCSPDFKEIANLPVTLTRAFGDQEDAISIIGTRDIGPQCWQALVMGGLDTIRYPMASQDGPFDPLMSKLGVESPDTLAQDQRLMLLNAVEATGSCFAFARATHNAQGEEICQSALFEELVGVYRTLQDDESDLPVQAVPQALQPWLCCMSEADVLFSSKQQPSELEQVMRGELDDRCARMSLLQDAKGRPLVLSPTALEDYYRCPYLWFTSRRVGYNGMDTKFDVAAQGGLAHAVLERFYREFARAGHARVTPSNLDEALLIASQAFDAQVEHEAKRERRGVYLKTQSDKLACEKLRAQVLSLVERDASFLPGFTPTYFELELEGSGDSPLEYAGVPVRGKVDRIDVDANGNAVIIDYKLSKLDNGYGFSAKSDLPARLQTDIYATLVQRYFDAQGMPLRVLGSVYRSYAANMLRGVYDGRIEWGTEENVKVRSDALPRSGSEENYEAYLQRVESVMSACVERMKAGQIKPAPLSSDACKYCKGRLFCPRRES